MVAARRPIVRSIRAPQPELAGSMIGFFPPALFAVILGPAIMQVMNLDK